MPTFINDVILEVSKNLSTQELSTAAQVSKTFHAISIKDALWSTYLMRDFHFTAEAAGKLKTRLQTTYKNAYRYCKTYQFNEEQKKALADFKKNGLTENHLCGRDEYNHPYHNLALEHLLKKKYPIDKAMQELSGLTDIQADGIRYDVPKEELQPLTTINQIYTIERYYNLGVRAHHLLHLTDKDSFSFFHADALKYLLRKKGNTFDILTLINQLNKLSFYQACLIVKTEAALMPADLYDLSELQTYFVSILFEEKGLKINPKDLLERKWSISKEYMNLFVYLLRYKEKSVQEAFQFVDSLFADNLDLTSFTSSTKSLKHK